MTQHDEPITPLLEAVDYDFHGLSKRELFASMAMQNLISLFIRKSQQGVLEDLKKEYNVLDAESVITRLAVAFADSLIDELNRGAH